MGNTHINNKTNNFNIFEKALSIPIILNKIFLFLDKDNIKCLSLCNKKIYKFYCNQVKKLIITKECTNSNLKVLINKYINANDLNLRECKNIKDFKCISKLEILNFSFQNISDI